MLGHALSRWYAARYGIPVWLSNAGKGALGGKGRGYRFLHSFLDSYTIRQHFPDVNVRVPRSIILATGVFDEFVDENNLLHKESPLTAPHRFSAVRGE